MELHELRQVSLRVAARAQLLLAVREANAYALSQESAQRLQYSHGMAPQESTQVHGMAPQDAASGGGSGKGSPVAVAVAVSR